MMNLSAVGCSFRTAPVELRERLAFTDAQLSWALSELSSRFGCEAVILSTCNRVEIYVAQTGRTGLPDLEILTEFLAECHRLDPADLAPHMYEHRGERAVRHLLRVSASLDSLVVGEGQIAGQVKSAYELATQHQTAGPLMNALFQHARRATKRVHTETGITQGNVSVSSAAVEFVRGVFSTFHDKTVLVIGAGKMGGLTLPAIQALKPSRILIANRTFSRAADLARSCGGEAVLWAKLDEALAQADIIFCTTGAPQPILTRDDFSRTLRTGPKVIVDIAIPRDVDPAVGTLPEVFLVNIDDLNRNRERVLAERRRHLPPAESIVEQETKRFLVDWLRRRNGAVIQKLQSEVDTIRQAVVEELFAELKSSLSDTDRKRIEGKFRLFQNRLLHGPISAIQNDTAHESGTGGHLLDALRKLFRLGE